MARARRVNDDKLPEDRAPAHLVESLVALNFRREDVERWPAVRARAVLEKYQRDTSNAVSRADGVAVRNDGTTFPPPQPERDSAASWLASALGKTDGWELELAIENACRHLADDERLRLATYLIPRLKSVPALPESGQSLLRRSKTAPARQDDGETAAEVGIEL